MLDAFATNTAQKNPNDKVIFAIHDSLPNTWPLLRLELEMKYESMKLRNITVETFKNVSDLDAANLTNAYLCIDEIKMGYVNPDCLNGINA